MLHTPTYKTVNKKYGKTRAKIANKMPWNKLCVDLIGPYKVRREGREPLILESVTMIYRITRRFEITPYNYKKSMAIANLVETTLLFR